MVGGVDAFLKVRHLGVGFDDGEGRGLGVVYEDGDAAWMVRWDALVMISWDKALGTGGLGMDWSRTGGVKTQVPVFFVPFLVDDVTALEAVRSEGSSGWRGRGFAHDGGVPVEAIGFAKLF